METNEKRGHLHLHTGASDGLVTIEDIAESGISFTAITDHDTMEGIGKFMALEKHGIEVIPGIELSARHMGKNMHMLVYYPKAKPELYAMLEEFRMKRVKRALTTAEKLAEHGIIMDRAAILAEKGLIAKGNMARMALDYPANRALLATQGIKDAQEFIQAYLNKNKPGHVKLGGMEVSELIKLVDGVKVLAHPAHNLDMGTHDYIVEDLAKNYGIWGIEVWTRKHDPGAPEYYLNLAKKLGLYPIISNDVHAKEDLSENRAPYEMVEAIKKQKTGFKAQQGALHCRHSIISQLFPCPYP
ncbi:MAG: PHP domain-containing protein [Nanoarchaeota archaeon]|nr:PHP domain-containing protein [Nanoarchaeota archaeon]